MNSTLQPKISASELLSDAFRALSRIRKFVAIYFGVILGLALIASLLGVFAGIINVLTFFGYFVAQYFLCRKLLEASGLSFHSETKIVSFFAMAIMLGIPIGLGLQLFLLPGVFLAAKWIMAPTFLVADDKNLFEAVGASWRASGSNTVSLPLAFAALFVPWLVLLIVFSQFSSWFDLSYAASLGTEETSGSTSGGGGSTLSDALGAAIFHLLPVLLMGLSVSAYRALSDKTNRMVAVFE